MTNSFVTKRLNFRQARICEAEAFAAFQFLPLYGRYIPGSPCSHDRIRQRIRLAAESPNEEANRFFKLWAVRLRWNGFIMGEATLFQQTQSVAEIGFGLHPGHWGLGYGSEIAQALVELGFNEFKLHRVAARVAVENAASTKILLRLGMMYEGTHRDCTWSGGRWWSFASYAILENEYRGRVDSQLYPAAVRLTS